MHSDIRQDKIDIYNEDNEWENLGYETKERAAQTFPWASILFYKAQHKMCANVNLVLNDLHKIVDDWNEVEYLQIHYARELYGPEGSCVIVDLQKAKELFANWPIKYSKHNGLNNHGAIWGICYGIQNVTYLHTYISSFHQLPDIKRRYQPGLTTQVLFFNAQETDLLLIKENAKRNVASMESYINMQKNLVLYRLETVVTTRPRKEPLSGMDHNRHAHDELEELLKSNGALVYNREWNQEQNETISHVEPYFKLTNYLEPLTREQLINLYDADLLVR